ncbi:MAG: hypothetical protein CFE31_17270 [Rhizobiales bacterium PAR1]|nr:MAG: hypothetical protein CFE31_17270 [Rhizobiales bacterium PAR1]
MVVGLAPAALAQAPVPPQSGISLGVTLGGGWSSNPLEITGKHKGDAYLGSEIVAGYRWALAEKTAFSISVTGFSELYRREEAGGINRAIAAASLSHTWQEATFTLGFAGRTAMNQRLTAHDSASNDVSIGVSRPFKLAENLTLTLNSTLSRRFMQDGTEDQFRARFNITLARKWEKWTFRVGGGFGYTLEDKTPILPRINDRSLSANIGATYEWQKDREISVRLAYTRMYSSYAPDRYAAFSFAPQIAATFRF